MTFWTQVVKLAQFMWGQRKSMCWVSAKYFHMNVEFIESKNDCMWEPYILWKRWRMAAAPLWLLLRTTTGWTASLLHFLNGQVSQQRKSPWTYQSMHWIMVTIKVCACANGIPNQICERIPPICPYCNMVLYDQFNRLRAKALSSSSE